LVLAPQVEDQGVVRDYQWRRNGVVIAGATAPVLALPRVSAESAGTYALEARAIGGATSTWTAGVSVGAAPSRLANISVRGWIGGPGEQLTLGMVSNAATAVPILVRALGPALERFGVSEFVRDPRLTVYDRSGQPIAANDEWSLQSGAGQIADVATRVGAAALSSGSKDAAVLLDVTAGPLTFTCGSANGSTGAALVELFSPDSPTMSLSPLRNFSVRARTSTGDGALILGFVISGSASRTVLIRGIGPALRPFGVRDAAGDPVLVLFDDKGRPIGSNDDWEERNETLSLRPLFSQLGAFELPAGSRDAALLITLAPGAYTVRCDEKDRAAGAVLVEVYDVQ
jgi:hypothetical protein